MMKKLVLSAILLALLIPAMAFAEDKPPVSNVMILGHIDFVARYSSPDWNGADNDWDGYETYNLEHAVVGVAGRLGTNVDWAIVEAFAFTGPFGPANSAAAVADGGDGWNNDASGYLLDARMDWHLTENFTVTAGRFIPPTSMTWAPHMMKVVHTINYPLINNGGLVGMMLPSPMYQTGVMLTAKASGLSFQVGNFNGSETVGGMEFNDVAILGLDNTMDIDKTKGTAFKVAYDGEGFHAGGWYYAEEAGVRMDLFDGATLLGHKTVDGQIDQWGAEAGYTSDAFLLQGQYLSSTFDDLDRSIPGVKKTKNDLVQSGWYGLVGAQASGVQLIYRFDQVYYDSEGALPSFVPNDENAHTVGVNYLVNPNVTVGLNYVWRQIDGWDANTNELGFIMEANLF
jgi:hypothetical protein